MLAFCTVYANLFGSELSSVYYMVDMSRECAVVSLVE